MKMQLTTALAAVALTCAGPAHADGFAYKGSPKQGEFFVRQLSARPAPDWTNARAQMPPPAAPPARGGIGLRLP